MLAQCNKIVYYKLRLQKGRCVMDFTVIILVFIIILQLAVIFMLYRSRAGAVDEKTLLNLCGILKQPNGACMKVCATCAASRQLLPALRVWKPVCGRPLVGAA